MPVITRSQNVIYKCKEIRHLSRKCKKKAYSSTSYKGEKKIGKKKCNPNKFKAKPSKVHQVKEEYSESSENEQEWSVFTVKSIKHQIIAKSRLTLTLKVWIILWN